MTRVRIGRWGQALAVRLPAEMADSMKLEIGDVLAVEQRGDELVFRAADKPMTLDSLFAGLDPAASRRAYAAQAAEIDWGEDVGEEIVPPPEMNRRDFI